MKVRLFSRIKLLWDIPDLKIRMGLLLFLSVFLIGKLRKVYIRKLTLAPAVTAYQHLKKGETILLTWQIAEGEAKDYSDFVQHTWEYCYDTYSPKPV